MGKRNGHRGPSDQRSIFIDHTKYNTHKHTLQILDKHFFDTVEDGHEFREHKLLSQHQEFSFPYRSDAMGGMKAEVVEETEIHALKLDNSRSGHGTMPGSPQNLYDTTRHTQDDDHK